MSPGSHLNVKAFDAAAPMVDYRYGLTDMKEILYVIEGMYRRRPNLETVLLERVDQAIPVPVPLETPN